MSDPAFNRPATSDQPRYRLTTACFFEDDTLRPEGTEVIYLGTPNEYMLPLNDAAEERMRKWLDQLDRAAELKAAVDGKAFVRRAGDLGDIVEQAMKDRPRELHQMPRDIGPIPQRPDMVSREQRKQRADAKSKKLLSVFPPEPPKRNEPSVPILGTIGRGEF